MIYTSFKSWLEALKYYAKSLFWDICGLFVICLIMGMVSVILFVARRLKRGFLRETFACVFLAACLFAVSAGWLTTFVKERHSSVYCQHKADSLAFELSRFTQAYEDGDKVVIGDDTITIRIGR
jgi:hypothetical protein